MKYHVFVQVYLYEISISTLILPDMDSNFYIVFSRALWYDKAIWAGEIR